MSTGLAVTRLVATWGNGDFGRLGHGVQCLSEDIPRLVAALRDVNAAAVACGGAHTAVVSEDGRVFTMGLNDYGQCGHSPDAQYVPVPQQVPLPEPAVAVAAGHFHTIALTLAGGLWTWGRNSRGQLGAGRAAGHATAEPQRVAALDGACVRSVSAGAEHSLAVTAEGEVYSWGNADHGRLGHGKAPKLWLLGPGHEDTPRLVRGLLGVKAASATAADSSSGVLDESGDVYTWGNARFFQLGLGSRVTTEEPHPTLVQSLRGVRQLALGGLHGAAAREDGTLLTWGSNDNGALGLGSESKAAAREPTPIPKFQAEQVSCGWKHCAALTAHGQLWAWGWGGSAGEHLGGEGRSSGGQLGLGNEFDFWTPMRSEWLQVDETNILHRRNEGEGDTEDMAPDKWRYTQVSAGFNHTAAILEIRDPGAADGDGQSALVASSAEYAALQGLTVLRADTGDKVELTSLWQPTPGTRVVVAFLTHFADLSSFEFAEKLSPLLGAWRTGGVKFIAVGLGGPPQARKFAEMLKFPLEDLYADPAGACYTALDFNPGFAPETNISAYAKLLAMLAGVGSPGTIQEVLRGYVGDKSAPPVFTGSNPFDVLGRGFQRPFELATLRLYNMVDVLRNWGELAPEDERLLTQQGGCLVFDGAALLYKHADSGILKFADVREVSKALASDTPPTQVLRPFM